MKICAYDDETHKLIEIIANEHKPTIVRVPGLFWHGTKTISSDPSLTVYFTNKLYEYSDPDEESRAWNDKTLVPQEINGNKNDARVNQPWDWFSPPHK